MAIGEIHIRPAARDSIHSGREFQPGDRIVSFLAVSEEGDYERFDVLETESPGFVPPGKLLCRWSQVVKPRESQAAERRAAIQSAEDMFLSLEDEDEDDAGDATSDPDRALLRYLLAIVLERKRILRPVRGERSLYRHPSSGNRICCRRGWTVR